MEETKHLLTSFPLLLLVVVLMMK